MTTIDSDYLNKLDKERMARAQQVNINIAYVKGKNPITLNEAPKKAPDNRITIPLAKIAVNSLCGYKGEIQHNYENIAGNVDDKVKLTAYQDAQKTIAEYNDETIETSELYYSGLTAGVSYELLWVSKDTTDLLLTPEYRRIPAAELSFIWSRDLKPKLTAAIRYQTFDDEMTADVYYPLLSERWVKRRDGELWARDEEGDTEYPYKNVPLAMYPINEDEECLFEAEKGLIDANDKIFNKTVNEIDRFNALIALMPGEISKEFGEKMKEIGIIDNLGEFEHWPEYLQKDLTGVTELYTGAMKWVKDLFFQSVSVPDFSDKEFLNAASGIAMAYKLIGLEFIASKIDTYFNKGLQQRNELINDVLALNGFNVDDYKMVITSQRNLPVDNLGKAQVAQLLKGIVSDETLLRMLPFVKDVEKELERIAGQAPGVDLDNLNTDEDVT